jgi:pimeloyl-ACP methyl ester carboxylesterase
MAVAAREQLERFRSTRVEQVLAVDGVEWGYFDSGGNGPIHLLLHGGLGDGESCFSIFEPLAATARIVAPSIPATVQTVTSVANGLTSILGRISDRRVHVFGHSQGGYVAQVLVRAIPDRVASITLSGTCLPSEDRARTIERQLRLVGALPELLLRAGAIAQLRRIASVDLKTLAREDRDFWMDYLTDGVRAPGLKPRVAASARLQLDYHRNAGFTSGDMAHWRGRSLILTGGLDPIMGPEEGSALIRQYPDATHQAFPEQGHLGAFLHPERVVGLLAQLAQGDPRLFER